MGLVCRCPGGSQRSRPDALSLQRNRRLFKGISDCQNDRDDDLIFRRLIFRRQAVMVSQKRGCTMKIGDRFKDKITGKIYIIRMETDNDTLFLEGENGLGRRLTGKESLKRTCEKLEDKNLEDMFLPRRE